MDCSTSQGLDRAISQDLLSAGIVDVVHTTSLTDMSRLFVNDGMYGRPVVMIRNPLHRALAKYEWMRVMDENVKTMTLKTFAKSGKFSHDMCQFVSISTVLLTLLLSFSHHTPQDT